MLLWILIGLEIEYLILYLIRVVCDNIFRRCIKMVLFWKIGLIMVIVEVVSRLIVVLDFIVVIGKFFYKYSGNWVIY